MAMANSDPNQTQELCPVCEKLAGFCSCQHDQEGANAPTGQWIRSLADRHSSPPDQTLDRPTSAKSRVGTVINDRYELLEVLGQGGMGSVFKAKHLLLERIYALKTLKSTTDDNEESRARFDREAKTAARLSHPALVSVYDYGTTAYGEAFIVMDFVAGKSLGEMISTQGPLETPRALRIFSQIIDGLAYTHANGVIHRDLKPSNVMIVTNEKNEDIVKIVDFGIAKIVEEQTDTTPALTKTGELFGSPMYMSPEQCRGQKPDRRSDIYSFGCLMYESLTGQPPFTAENSLALIFKHIHEKPPGFDTIQGQIAVPEKIAQVVSKALAKTPDDRFQTMEEVNEALDNAAQGLSVQRSTASTLAGKKWMAASAAAALLSLFGAGMFLFGENFKPHPAPQKAVPFPTLTQPLTQPPQPPAHQTPTLQPAPFVPLHPASPSPPVTAPKEPSADESQTSKHDKRVHSTYSSTSYTYTVRHKQSSGFSHKLESKFKSILRKLSD
jgi:eukaryotic-like serine/threonine-protein kinase